MDGATKGFLLKSGPGTLSLTGTDTHTGGTMILDGVLNFSGAISGPIVINSPGVFDVTNTITITDLSATAGSTLISEPGTILTFGTALFTTFAGQLTGSGQLIKQNSGTWTLTGVGSFSGALNINAGTLNLAGGGIGPMSTTTIASGASLTGIGRWALLIYQEPFLPVIRSERSM